MRTIKSTKMKIKKRKQSKRVRKLHKSKQFYGGGSEPLMTPKQIEHVAILKKEASTYIEKLQPELIKIDGLHTPNSNKTFEINKAKTLITEINNLILFLHVTTIQQLNEKINDLNQIDFIKTLIDTGTITIPILAE